jgi:hypothetical protein
VSDKNFSKGGEDTMRSAIWTGALILIAAVLAICELSYAHAALPVLWPLQVLALSVWRLVHVPWTALHPVPWVAPLTFMLAGVLWWIAESRSRRKARAVMVKGENHE